MASPSCCHREICRGWKFCGLKLPSKNRERTLLCGVKTVKGVVSVNALKSGAKALESLISQLMIKIQANPSKNNEGKTSVEFSMYTFDISSTLVLD